jgi:predicted transcriptional regulator
MPHTISGTQLRAARALLEWKRENLAASTGLSVRHIGRIEDGSVTPRASTIAAIRAAVEEAGVEFIPAIGGGRGVRLKEFDR